MTDAGGTNNNLPAPSPLGIRIHTVRGQAVMLDSDLATAYQVETKAMNRAVRRNGKRFPESFAFQLSKDEWDALRCQIGTLDVGRGRYRKYLPYAFTEHGAVMLATILNSDRAIAASLQIVQAFVRMRHLLNTNHELARRIDELSAKFEKKTGEDSIRFAAIFKELQRLALGYDIAEAKPRGRIGFKTNEERGASGKARKGKT